MHFLDVTLPTLAENLALDEALLLEADAGRGGEVLRLWEWPTFAVVLGAGCRLAEDVDESACRSDGVPILRRASGGGTVLLGPGSLLFSLTLAYDRADELREIRPSQHFILDVVRRALLDLQPSMELAGTSDLAFGGRKFSGNSQQRKRRFLLHHGTLLYAFDLERVARYLRMPARQPEYRGRRVHADFLTNLLANGVDLRQRLRAVWEAKDSLTAYPAARVHELVTEKYSKEEWTRRR